VPILSLSYAQDFPIPINSILEPCRQPWLPYFVADNIERAHALEQLLGRDVPKLLVCVCVCVCVYLVCVRLRVCRWR
jgi:hypothetical protein